MIITIKPKKQKIILKELIDELKDWLCDHTAHTLKIKTLKNVKQMSMLSLFSIKTTNNNIISIESRYFRVYSDHGSSFLFDAKTLEELDDIIDELSEDVDLLNMFIDLKVSNAKFISDNKYDYINRITNYIKPHISKFDIEEEYINNIMTFYNKIDNITFGWNNEDGKYNL